MPAYWLIIGPLVVLNLILLFGVWYAAGTVARVGPDRRSLDRDRRPVDAGGRDPR